MRVLGSIRTIQGLWLEKYLHRAFDHRRTRGEWFRLEDAEIALLLSTPQADRVGDLPTAIIALHRQNTRRLAPKKKKPLRPRVVFMSDEEYAGIIGRNVRQARESAGLTQEQLGVKAGMAAPHVSRLEAGGHLPSLKTVKRVAEALDVDVPDLLPTPKPRKRRKP
jgi:ribosome-binding protein aMBF1 (putative translation factor)